MSYSFLHRSKKLNIAVEIKNRSNRYLFYPFIIILIFSTIIYSQNKSATENTKGGPEDTAFRLVRASYAKPDSVLKEVDLLLKRINPQTDEAKYAAYLYVKGYLTQRYRKFLQAKEIFLRVLEISSKHNLMRLNTDTFIKLGYIEITLTKYDKAAEYFFGAEKKAVEINNPGLRAQALNGLGILHYVLKDFDYAEKYLNEASQIAGELEDDWLSASVYEHKGLLKLDTPDFPKAQEYFRKAYDHWLKTNDKFRLAGIYDNFGIIDRRLEKFKEAKAYFLKSIQIKKEIGDSLGLVWSMSFIVDINVTQGNLKEAVKYLENTLSLHIKYGDERGIGHVVFLLSDYLEKMGNYRKALFYNKWYWAKKDSGYAMQKASSIAELQRKHELSNKELQIKFLEEKDSARKKFQYLLITSLIILSVSLMILAVNFGKSKKYARQLEETGKQLNLQNEELGRLNNSLQNVIADKDNLIGIIGHDIKNPFLAIKGYSEILLKEYKELPESEAQEMLNHIISGINDLDNLLSNLIQWARLNAGKYKLNPENINVKNEIDTTLRLYNPLAKLKKLNFDLKCENDLFVRADRQMFNIIIRNLISNAIKYSKPDGNIEIHSHIKESEVLVSVSDFGVGMDEDKLSQIFTGNIESLPGTFHEKGTGLGLQLVQNMTDLNDGRIWAESKVGEFTSFRLVLPAGYKSNEIG